MMWLLLTEVDPQKMTETVLGSDPVVLMIAGVLIVAILMAALMIAVVVVGFKLTNKWFDSLDERLEAEKDKRDADEKRRERELKAMEDLAAGVNALTGQGDARYRLLQEQITVMRESQAVGIEARDEAKRARVAVEDLKPSIEAIETLVKALPEDLKEKLQPVADEVAGLSALVSATKESQDQKVAELIAANESHMTTLTASVGLIERNFAGILAAMVGGIKNGVSVDINETQEAV